MLPSELEEFCEENGDAMMCQDYYDTIPDGWNADLIKQHGGEAQGDSFYTVYKFTRGDEYYYVKFYGWWQSYVGSEYEGFSVVKPHTKTITVYE